MLRVREARSDMRSVPRAVATGSVAKVAQIISLSIYHVRHSFCDTLFSPQVSLTPFLGPRTRLVWPSSILAHLSGRICLERTQSAFGLDRPDGDDYVYVISSDVESMQMPRSKSTSLANGIFNGFTLKCAEEHWLANKNLNISIMPLLIRWNVRGLITIVEPID